MFIPRVTAESIAVSGSGSTAETTITLPATFTPAGGCIYDILISAQVPAGTDGTIITLTNGAETPVEASIYQRGTGNYARARALGWRKVLRVQYFDDPSHYNLIAVRG